jgi:hypothetical protein
MPSSKQKRRRIYGTVFLALLGISALAIVFHVSPINAEASWWDPGWTHRKMIMIDHTKVSADLINFPLLVDIVDSDLASKAQYDGEDIVFTDDSQLKLDHELESYESGTGHLVCWVSADLSSASDTTLYMYYGNAGSSDQQNSAGVWDNNYCMVQHLEEAESPSSSMWHKYEGNPILNGTRNGFASVFYETETSTYHLFCSWSGILHFTSPNGKTGWTADSSNPVLTSADVPMVWKEGGVWYMLYRYGSPLVIGLANSTDATHWIRYEGNPVLTGVTGTWEDPSYGLDPWGAIKVGSTYYLWYNTVGGGALGRCIGLATSTDLKSWTKDANNPIFQGGRFCSFAFKFGSYYYMLVPHYTASPYGEIELYRDTNPTFYPSSREFLGVPIVPGPAGAWDDHRFDTPAVFTDNIYRDTYTASNNELWTYYGGTGTPTGSGADWWTGMCIEQNITDALTRIGTVVNSHHDSTSNRNEGRAYGNLNMNVTGKINGADGFDGINDYIDCDNGNSLKGMNALTIEAWVKPNAVAASGIVAKWSSWTAGTGGSYILWQSSLGKIGWGVVTETSSASLYDTPALQPGEWYHLVGTYNGSQIRLYMNATQVGTPTSIAGTVASTSDPCYIGRYISPYMNGTIDEVRISNVSRSTGWITTEYNNQRSPSTFYSVGTEETRIAEIYIDPPVVEKGSGDIGTAFKVNVTVANIADLWAFDFNITWDNSLVTLVSVDFGTALDLIWGPDNWFVAFNMTGIGFYELAAVSMSAGFTSAQPATVATLEFRVENAPSGETPIHFAMVKLSDSESRSIYMTKTDGLYRISGQPLPNSVVRTNPSLVEKTFSDVGTFFNVSVIVQNTTSLFGFDFNITWNNALTTVHSCYYTETLDLVWNPDNWQIVKNENGAGWYKMVAISTRDSFNTTGSQILFILEFRVEDPHSTQETAIHFLTHKLSDPQWTAINHTTVDGTYRFTGGKPSIQMIPGSETCRKYNETFTVEVNVTDAYNVEDFKFEIDYNTTLLDFRNITWSVWGSGTLSVDETGGNITGYTSGSPINGTVTLISIEFGATYHHIWKNLPGWVNDQSGTIFIQRANFSYAGAADLGYERAGLSQIDVGPDFQYTFSPIQGDVDNNGYVDIYDLRTLAYYYDTVNPEYNITGEDVVDIFDLVMIGSNYGYAYIP